MNDGNIISWLDLKNEECPEDAAALAKRWEDHFEEHFAGFHCPEAWVEVVHIALCAMEMIDPGFQIGQVKEKFGGLRVYFTPSSTNDAKRFQLNLVVQWAELYCADIERTLRQKRELKKSE